MDLKEFYIKTGGDYENAVQRLSSEKLLIKYICKFADEPSYNALKAAFSSGDVSAAFRAAHTIKGTALSLGLGYLTDAASALTEALRNASVLPSEELLEIVDKAYKITIENIALLDKGESADE